MTPKQYVAALGRLGFSIVGSAPHLGISRRQSQRYASGEQPVPRTIEILLRMMMKEK
jgi:hypothetical protein